MASARHWEQDKEATVYVGNLDERITDALIWELMIQVGRVVNVHLPKDRVSQNHQGYGFVEFNSEVDAEYAAKVMNQVRLHGKPIRVNKASADKQKTVDIGAELFIGNLDTMADERTLYDTFSRFGTLITPPKVARDEMNLSKGYGFVSYADFESSDEAIASMHGSYFMDKEITVQYAYKKDGKGERHGDEAERQLAAEARRHNVQPTIMPMPPQLVQQPPGPSVASGANVTPTTPGYAVNGTYNSMPPLQQHGRHPSQPLPPPPAGLPSRPPPSQAGYGGPAVMSAPPYGQMGPGGYSPQNGVPAPFPPPPGQGGFPPPPGMAPPGMAPPGMPPMGFPPPPNQRY